jgi:hypothetical protein
VFFVDIHAPISTAQKDIVKHLPKDGFLDVGRFLNTLSVCRPQ